jgi:hypothetical protein
MLVTDRRRAFGRRADVDARDPGQGSLFAPDALTPPAKPPRPTPDPFAPPRPPAASTPPAEALSPSQSDLVAAPPDAIAPSPDALAPRADAVAPSADALTPPADPVGPSADVLTPPADPTALPADACAPPADRAALPADEVAPSVEALRAAPDVAWSDYAGEAEDALVGSGYADTADLEPAHARVTTSRSVLAGPTLDDVMSRAWEGLRAEVPTPCPVCRAEIEPSAHGRCGACGSTLD